jgi:AraC-like DNA-binding protein
MQKERQQTEPTILKRLAHLLGTEVKNRRLEIPAKFGKGYCTGFVFNEYIRMIIMNYELNENLALNNPDINASVKMILFKFQNLIPKIEISATGKQLKAIPSVLITTSGVNTDVVIPIHTNTATINIEVDSNYLNGLFDLSEKSPVLRSLLQNTQPLLFEQMIYPSLQKITDEILSESVGETFELFFMKVKAEELICRLLMEVEKRDEKRIYDLNILDIQTIYNVREQILEHLETPPVINDLAIGAGMSPTKLKRLFKQIFGDSIFSYYQEFRMKEAALLLKEEKLSVSDVGYQMGFTNLSHFSKVFKERMGMKPKQYSRSF